MNSMRQRVQDEGGEEKEELSIIYFFFNPVTRKCHWLLILYIINERKQADVDPVLCFFNTYNTQRFGKGSGIFCTPKLRTQISHHTFLENICCPTGSGQQSAQRIR